MDIRHIAVSVEYKRVETTAGQRICQTKRRRCFATATFCACDCEHTLAGRTLVYECLGETAIF
jgi:hypothetical protein